MARRKEADLEEILKLIGLLIIGIGTILTFIIKILSKGGTWLLSYLKKTNQPTLQVEEKNSMELAKEIKNIFLDTARAAEKNRDYLRARVQYMKCIEDLKRNGAPQKEIDYIEKEYEEFVKRDPIFRELINRLLPFIKENPGILQSQISKHFQSVEWPELYNYNRPVAKEDIYYALYFADKFGIIQRVKKGRSYQLFLNETSNCAQK
jgi:hypothetical protein